VSQEQKETTETPALQGRKGQPDPSASLDHRVRQDHKD